MRIIIFLLFFLFSCKQNAPEPQSFNSYEQVSDYLSETKFVVDESTDTSNSSFITSAEYQSLDGKTGYLTLGMRGKTYHFKGVPKGLWEDFKGADSKGKFYHRFIKGKYTIHLMKN